MLVATAVLVSQLDGVVQSHLVGEVLEVLVHRRHVKDRVLGTIVTT